MKKRFHAIQKVKERVGLVPSKDQLKKPNDNALDATLIAFFEDKEIARFDLKKK